MKTEDSMEALPSVVWEDREKVLFMIVPSALKILDSVWNYALDSFFNENNVFLWLNSAMEFERNFYPNA